MDETVRPLCVGSVSPPPLSPSRCRRILTNKITRRQGVPLFLSSPSPSLPRRTSRSLLLSFPSIRYSKRPTVTDTTAMIRPGRLLDVSPRDYAESRRRRFRPRALFHARPRPAAPVRSHARPLDRLVRPRFIEEVGVVRNKKKKRSGIFKLVV